MTADQLYQQGLEHFRAGRWAEAEMLYHSVLKIEPEHADALNSLGVLAQKAGRPGEAERLVRGAIESRPQELNFRHNLALVLEEQERFEEAVEQYRDVLAGNPDHAPALLNLGFALARLGRVEDAIDALGRGLALEPAVAHAHFVLGSLLRERGQIDRAMEHLREAVALAPDFAEAQNNLGIALRERGDPDGAIACYREGLRLRPDYAGALTNLGQILTETGRFDESLEFLRRAEALGAGPQAGSNLLYAILFNPRIDVCAAYEEHRQWNRTYAAPLAGVAPPRPADGAGRRLRIGYISPNFRNHVVGRFLLPLFLHHDHVEFEIFCYSDVERPDPLTGQLRACADTWRDTAGLSDEGLAGQIREDRIDILIDLTMHMEGSRLLTFARRPAPVQATYLAYAGTTGLEAMDYRLADSYLDPDCSDQSFYSERSISIDPSYWCYPVPTEAPPPGPSPALVAGHVTFGCLNSFWKINEKVLEVWGAILRRVPKSRLMLHAPPGSHREELLGRLAREGIDSDRIAFVVRASGAEYFSLYRAIDIALDPFPYPGGTTTCDALWMGVPVVTLAGTGAIARAGVSILSNVGLPALIASTGGEYLQLATALAADLPRLGGLRAGLREQMHRSPLMDAKRFARDVENAYRRMWTERLIVGKQ